MRTRSFASLAVVATLTAAIAAACSGSSGTSGSTSGGAGGGAEDAGADAPSSLSLRIEPDMASATVTLGSAPGSLTFHAFAKMSGGAETDVTSQVDWSTAPKIGTVSGGVVTLTGNGGKATVSATLSGVTAQAALTVKVQGDVFGSGTDATTKQGFDTAMADPDPSAAPALEYP
jgi:hypothetical protein